MAFESLTDRLAGVFKKLRGHGKLTEADIKAAMREVRMALLEADVNYKVAKDFCAKVSERAMGQEVMESLTPAQQVVKIVNEELVALMGGSEAARLNIKNKGQTVIMLCGLQGNGKTTHAAKLAKFYIKQGRRPMLVACDIYRPAAIDQLQVVGKQAGAPVFNLRSAFPYLINNSFPTPCHQCVVIENGKVSTCGRCIDVPNLCDECGYFFVAEYTLLFKGNPKIILEMLTTYLRYI